VRSLATIVGEIHGTLRNDIASIIKRGELLQEAKDTTHAVVHDRCPYRKSNSNVLMV
jgi:hypothetical protein